MKKGIVMELHQEYMIVMANDGTFQKAIPIKGVDVGTEIEYDPLMKHSASLFFLPKRKLNRPLRLLTLACFLLVLGIPFYLLVGEEETYAYVNVDINPSIELKIDESLLVNSMQPLNKEASEIVDNLTGFQHEHLETVIEMIMHESEDTGLVNEAKHMLVGVSYVTDDQEKGASILDQLRTYFIKANPSWTVAAFKVPEKVRQKAKEKNKPMNEVMATTIMETDEDDFLDENDKAIINTFYNTDKPEHK
ncbi:hypothetical protein JOC34_002602 [Virgibacillus halotolerans]|uniref:anti-sigma-I factor RsgI family protein n=1 Tax=Virgibacillus halotolerans TaxID=1071053 RepID=UPI0019616CA7|nr:anti-sigma factor domain-containing protein [Virgibacillus halotolerans]MBM7600211.1 hypothetical protein [Virgibacillus halotolerans]